MKVTVKATLVTYVELELQAGESVSAYSMRHKIGEVLSSRRADVLAYSLTSVEIERVSEERTLIENWRVQA